MATKAIFIGVNKHLDPSIPELSGAARDAIALWALFTDTLQDLSAHRLIDEQATYAASSEVLRSTLASAAEGDVVIVSFAGHGSADGRLVFHDTDATNLSDTALSMTVLADAFRTTKARAVLCLLDCCFSGHAPARVLDTNATPRNAFVLNGVHGEGRILISACTSTEAAWEQPGTGHGLLTYAVIEAMTKEPQDTISFPGIADEIISLARVEGQRMGVTQTPVFLGSVEGGLVFPRLLRGDSYRAAFPQTPVERMSGAFSELAAHGFPQALIDQWTARFPDGLNALQLRAVNEFGVLAGRSVLTVAPTSSGKTMIGELAAVQAILAGKKAVFLLPYRALVNEKYEEFTARYGAAGLRVARCSGDASDGVAPVLSGRYDLAIFTYEMFLNMALGSPRLLNQLGLVVLDEGQFITDPGRGMTVELILAMLIRARDRGIEPQLIVLSAVIGNLNGFDQWLSTPLLLSRERPVPLVEGVLDRQGQFQFVDEHGATKTEALLPPRSIVQRTAKPSGQDVIVPLAKKLVADGEKIIVFRNQRGTAQGCAKYLAKEIGKPPASSVLAQLPTQDLTSASQDLRDCLQGGTAFHNANLLRAEREAIERGFRNRDGGIHVLGSTTTLAAGINTPASTVILAENEFKGEDGRAFTVAEYKNMAGRAGRVGYNETGKAIILAETPIERAQLFRKYVLGIPEDVTSSFKRKDMPTWTLRLLSQVRGVRADEIPGLLINTFGGYSAARANPDWSKQVAAEIVQLVERLVQAGLAEREGDIVHLTLLGRAVGNSSLTFESGLRLAELMRGFDAADTPAFHVLAILQVLEEMDNVYTPLMKRGRGESVRVNDAIQRYGRTAANVLQRYCHEEMDVWRRCKRAAILHDWIGGQSIEEIERYYTANPFQGVVNYGDVMRIADSSRFHLRSAHQILSALWPEQPAFLESLDEVLRRLEFGLPAAALPLVRLPVTMTRGEYLALHKVGAVSAEAIAKLADEQLAACVGAATAAKLRGVFA